MKTVNLFGIALEYQAPWELHFGKAPTERVGAFELLLKKDYRITNALCVVWRPYDEAIAASLNGGWHNRGGLLKWKTFGRGTETIITNSEQAGELADEEIVARYCDGIYRSITKEQGPVALIKREKQRVNTHAAEVSEFTFPVNRRKKNLGEIYRVQLVLKCNTSERFVALYTSSREGLQLQAQIEGILRSFRCHENI